MDSSTPRLHTAVDFPAHPNIGLVWNEPHHGGDSDWLENDSQWLAVTRERLAVTRSDSRTTRSDSQWLDIDSESA